MWSLFLRKCEGGGVGGLHNGESDGSRATKQRAGVAVY